MAIPVLLYCSVSWTLTKLQAKRIEAAEMKFLRTVVGCTLRGRRRNEDILQELQMASVLEIDRYRRNWMEHHHLMNVGRLLKHILEYRPRGRRRLGRPKKWWNHQFDWNLGSKQSGLILECCCCWWWWWTNAI